MAMENQNYQSFIYRWLTQVNGRLCRIFMGIIAVGWYPIAHAGDYIISSTWLQLVLTRTFNDVCPPNGNFK